jgi:shikimate dehydrogenase
MGAGGSARAVVWALIEQGAEVTIWNRTPERAASLAGEFGAAAAPSGEWRAGRGDFDLVVNCTTVGMGENGADLKALPVDADAMGEPQTVVDLAYGPAETELVSAARASGANAVDGLEILVRQGAASLRLWTGLEPPIDVMRRAARQQDAPREQTAIPDPGARPRGGDGTQA